MRKQLGRRANGAQPSSNEGDKELPKRKRRKRDVPRRVRNTAQDAIAYEALTESGICVLGDGSYSVTLRLGDVNYQIAAQGVQEALIEKYALWINTFDSSQSLQISVINRVLDRSAVRVQAELPLRGDELDGYRAELNEVIGARLSGGRNNTVTDKYATITIRADDFEEARNRLMRLAAESITYLRSVGGCQAEVVNGQGRVEILHSILRPRSPLAFSYEQMATTAMTTKDVVAPWSIDFSDKSMVALGNESDSFVQVLFLDRLPAWLSDQVVRDLTEINTDLLVSLHARPLDAGEGLKLVNRRIADMEIQQANEEKKAAKQGYSADLVPHTLRRAHQEAVDLRRQLESSNEKLFSTTLLVAVSAPSKDELLRRVERVREAGRRHSCEFVVTKYMQEDAFNAALPLGRCDLPLFRTLTTATTAIMVPFTTQEIFEPGGLNYGVNKLSRNLIIGSRQSAMNGNAFFLGTSGAGKSMYGKNEMTQVILNRPHDDVLIIDPEREYLPIMQAFGGSRIEIHAASNASINPMELHPDPDEDNPVRRKAEFVLSMCEVLIGGSTGLTPSARSIIDRAATEVFTRYTQARRGAMPTLLTLFEELRTQPEPEAQALATSLELYARGSFSGFARETNVDRSNRLTVYDISRLGQDMKTFGMLVILEEVWGRIVANRLAGRRTWLYIDEFHVMFSNEFSAAYFQSIYKRARKYGVMATGLTQNIDELLGNERARLMLANSDVLALLNQTPTDAASLQQLFNFSQQETGFFTNVPSGHGLLKLGSAIVPFDNTIPEQLRIFQLFTTKFREQVRT